MPEAQAPALALDLDALKVQAEKLVTINYSTMEVAVQNIRITDEDTLQAAVTIRNSCHEAEKGQFEFWEPVTKMANKLHKSLTGMRDETSGRWGRLKTLANTKIEVYYREAVVAKKEADALMAVATEKERGRLQDEAQELMSRGYVEAAESRRLQAQVIASPVLPGAVSKVSGNRTTPKFVTTCPDPMPLIRAVADGSFPLLHEMRGEMRPILVIDQAVVNAITGRQLASTSIPGCETVEDIKCAPGK